MPRRGNSEGKSPEDAHDLVSDPLELKAKELSPDTPLPGRVYTLQSATNLMNAFSDLTNGIPATPTVNVSTDTVNGAVQKFYRVKVE